MTQNIIDRLTPVLPTPTYTYYVVSLTEREIYDMNKLPLSVIIRLIDSVQVGNASQNMQKRFTDRMEVYCKVPVEDKETLFIAIRDALNGQVVDQKMVELTGQSFVNKELGSETYLKFEINNY